MTAERKQYEEALAAAVRHAHAWLDQLPDRPVTAPATADEVRAALGDRLPDAPTGPADVVDRLATAAEPGLVATPSGRFFGFVIGGTHPAALAADWLVSAWDQDQGLRALSPAHAAIEDVTGAWLLDLLGLPEQATVGFVTGATMANFTGLAAARGAVLSRAGWDLEARGLAGAPPVRVLVGEERHATVDLTLRYLGLGAPEPVPADAQGRIRTDALATALAAGRGRPTIVCLQAGNVHSGDFDPFTEAIPLAREAGAWIHVDGAFGLWAAAAPRFRHLTTGVEAADSWTTDAHKTLNVPYDSGIVVVRDPAAMRAALGVRDAAYLITDGARLEPEERVPEMSRRSRAVPVWAVLRALGRSGVAEQVDRFCRHATTLADGARRLPGVEVLNEVVFTQVCLAFDTDERTRGVGRRLMADGTVWISGSKWRGREILRISVSNWSTDDDDIAQALDALAKAASG